jgi:hypothetical protein
LSELADYRKIHGHCNVRINTAKTPSWFGSTKEPLQVAERRREILYMTLSRIQGDLGFRMDLRHRHLGRPFERELADYRKSTGTAMFKATQRKHPAG